MSITVLTADTTYYVRTNGVDSSARDGLSEANAWASIAYAIERLGSVWPGDYQVTVDIGAGEYTYTTPIKFQHPFGKQFTFQGVSESYTGVVCTPGTSTYASGMTGVSAYSLTFSKPSGSSVAVGDFVLISSSTGANKPIKALGCHRVTAVTSSTVTVEVCLRTDVTLPSSTCTCSMKIVRTVLYANGCNGMYIAGPFHAGTWDQLVFKGSATGSGDYEGLWVLIEASVALTSKSGVWGFKNGLYAQNNSTIFADYATISKCSAAGCKAQNDAVINLRSAILNGVKNSGLEIFIGATAAAYGLKAHSLGYSTLAVVNAYKGGFVDVTASTLQYCTRSVLAKSGAFVSASGMDETGCASSMSPAADTVGNGNAYIDT